MFLPCRQLRCSQLYGVRGYAVVLQGLQVERIAVREEVREPSQAREEAADPEQGEQAEEGDGQAASLLLLPRDQDDWRQDAQEPVPAGDDQPVIQPASFPATREMAHLRPLTHHVNILAYNYRHRSVPQ